MAKTATQAAAYAFPFLLAFGLSVVMLFTDTNLRTDFGTVSSGYYAHWYVVLITAGADLGGALLLLALRSRRAIAGGVVGSGLLVVVFLGDILTYAQVGFSSPTAFARYLFGIDYGGGNIRYLYDVLLSVYLLAVLWGAVALWATREGRRAAPPPWPPKEPGPTPPAP